MLNFLWAGMLLLGIVYAAFNGTLPEVTEGYVLTAEAPYDELYRHYVEAQIHYANGETARYNNAAAQWNNAFLTYKDYCCRSAAPRRVTAALHLF